MNYLTNVVDTFWSLFDGGYNNSDELDLADTENGQCYSRRRTAQSRRQFHQIRYENVCRVSGSGSSLGVDSSKTEPETPRPRYRRSNATRTIPRYPRVSEKPTTSRVSSKSSLKSEVHIVKPTTSSVLPESSLKSEVQTISKETVEAPTKASDFFVTPVQDHLNTEETVCLTQPLATSSPTPSLTDLRQSFDAEEDSRSEDSCSIYSSLSSVDLGKSCGSICSKLSLQSVEEPTGSDNNMWNSKMQSAFTNSSHEFFDSFGLSDSITTQPRSHGRPVTGQTLFSSPGPKPQGKQTPFQPSTQAVNTSLPVEPPPTSAQGSEVPTLPVGGYGKIEQQPNKVENRVVEHQQKPAQALNTTAMLFASPPSGDHSFPSQNAVDPFKTAKVTPSNAGGTSRLFSGQYDNDPFDVLSSPSQNTQSFGPPSSNVALVSQMPVVSSGNNTEKQHSVKHLDAFSGPPIEQTQPLDKTGPSVTEPDAGHKLEPPSNQSAQISEASPAQIPPPKSDVRGFTQDNVPHTSSLFSGNKLPTATQDASSDTHQHTGETIPGMDMVKKTNRAVELPAALDSVESFGHLDITKDVASTTLQPPSLGLYPPTMVDGIDQSFNALPQSSSLYPPGSISTQPVNQSESLYPPGMDLGQSSLSTPASTGELFPPNSGILPPGPNILPLNLGVSISGHSENSGENEVASSSAPPDIESTMVSSEKPVSGFPPKDQEDKPPVEQNQMHLPSQPMRANESFDLEAMVKERPPMTESLESTHPQSIEPVAGTTGVPQLDPSTIAPSYPGSGLSDHQQAAPLQAVSEPPVGATSGEAVNTEAVKPTMASNDDVPTSNHQQAQPFQPEGTSTKAIFGDVVPPSNYQQAPPFHPEGASTKAIFGDAPPSNNQQAQPFQPRSTTSINATISVVPKSDNQPPQPFQPEGTSTKAIFGDVAPPSDNPQAQPSKPEGTSINATFDVVPTSNHQQAQPFQPEGTSAKATLDAVPPPNDQQAQPFQPDVSSTKASSDVVPPSNNQQAPPFQPEGASTKAIFGDVPPSNNQQAQPFQPRSTTSINATISVVPKSDNQPPQPSQPEGTSTKAIFGDVVPPSNNQQAQPFQPEGTSINATFDVVPPSNHQQAQPFQPEGTSTKAIFGDVVPPSDNQQPQPFQPEGTSTKAIFGNVVPPSDHQPPQPFQPEGTSTKAIFGDVVPPSDNQQPQPFQPRSTTSINATISVVPKSDNQPPQPFQPEGTSTKAIFGNVVPPSDNQQAQPFKPQVSSTKESYTESKTPQFDTGTTASHEGTRSLFSEQVPPSQPVSEPFILQTSTTKALHSEPNTPQFDIGTTASHGSIQPLISEQVPPSQPVSEPFISQTITAEGLHSEPGALRNTTVPSVNPHISPHPIQGDEFSSSSVGLNVKSHEDKNTMSSHDGEYLGGHPHQISENTTPTFAPVGTNPSTNVDTEIQGELHSSPSSAFIPVKANSPRHCEERRNTESPLRSPVQREKQEALLSGPRVQTSSLWDSEPQLAMPGLIVPTASKINNFVPGTDQKSQPDAPARSPNIDKAGESVAKPIVGIPGFSQTVYPSGGKPSTQLISTSSSNQELFAPSNQPPPLNEASGLSSFSEGSTRDSTSDLSRQSSLGVLNQDPALSNSPHHVVDQASGQNLGLGSNINEGPSVKSLPSSNRISDHHSQQFAPAFGTMTGLPQHTIMYSDASRSAVPPGKPQNEPARVQDGSGGRVVPGYGGHDGHVDRPAGSSADHGSGKSAGMVTHYGAGPSDGMSNQRGYGASDSNFPVSGEHGFGKSQGMVNQYGAGPRDGMLNQRGYGASDGHYAVSGDQGSGKNQGMVNQYSAGYGDGISNQRGYGAGDGNYAVSGDQDSGKNQGMVNQYGASPGVSKQTGFGASDGHFAGGGGQGSDKSEGQNDALQLQHQQQLQYQQQLYLQQQRQRHELHSQGQQQLQQQTQQSSVEGDRPGHPNSEREQYLQQQQQQVQPPQEQLQQQQLQMEPQQQLQQQQQQHQQQLYQKQQQQQLQPPQEQLQQQQLEMEQQQKLQQQQQQQQQQTQQQQQHYQQQLYQNVQQQQLQQPQEHLQQHQQWQQQQFYQQQQQQYQEHQQLQRQTSGQSNTNVASELQQYEDFDSEEECNRYYDESRKWFWSYKRNKWIRTDKSKREAEQFQDERYSRVVSGRRHYDDSERVRGKRRRDRRRDERYTRDYDDPYCGYYYDQREYRRRESYSSESSADSQRRVSKSGRSSRAESPHSISSRSSSRARRSDRHSKHHDYDYEDSYRRDADYYRSHQSSRSSRRQSSGTISSSTSNSLGENIKWDEQLKQPATGQVTSDYPVEKAVTPERLTPKQHNAPHIVGKFSSVSCMSLAPPRRILDGENAEVFVTDVTSDPKPNQMQNFPGPLSRGTTHKRDVVKFAQNQALIAFNDTMKTFEQREASYLLWQVLAVMVQQNGVYLSSDIAEVLTGELPEDVSSLDERSPPSSRRVSFGSEAQIFPEPCSQQHQMTTFRELLLCGKTQDALEYAVDAKMWGHAFTLAHKLDQNVFANIMSRFTSNLNEDDSLLCLYQHLSEKRPGIIDKKSKRWRKHLAMMIANPSKDPEQDKRNIHILGENLATRGLIEAAHLCYILAGEPVGKQNGTVLLGYSLHDIRPEFVDLLAVQRTEIFEYAMNLRDENYIIKDFQPWKAFYAHSLADAGLHVKAFRYCELMVNNILKYLPTVFTEHTIAQIHTLSLRLTQREQITPFLNMNEKLAQLLQLIQGGTTDLPINTWNQQTTTQQTTAQQTTPQQTTPRQDMPSNESQSYDNSQPGMTVDQTTGNPGGQNVAQTMFVPNMGSNYTPQKADEPSPYPVGQATMTNFPPQSEATTVQSDLYNMPYTSGFGSQGSVLPPGNQPYRDVPAQETVTKYSYDQSVPSSVGYEDFYEGDSFDHLRTQPNGANTEATGLSTSKADNSFDYYSASNFREEDVKKPEESANKEEKAQKESEKSEKDEKKEDKKNAKQGSGWSFGGFFKSLIPKGKNEMKLPDDNKKTIYWDEKEKRWINTEESEEDKTDLPPPPIDPSLVSGAPAAMPAIPSSTARQPTPTSGTSNVSQFNTPTSSPLASNTPKPPLAQAPPAMPATFTPEQPEVSLVNSPLTTPSRFSRRALGSKGRRSNYVDVLSASGGTTKLNQTASPMLFSPFPTPPGNQEAAATPFIPNTQPNTDGISEAVVSENNVVGNTTEQETSNAQDSQPPPPIPLLDPMNITQSPSRPRGRHYPLKR